MTYILTVKSRAVDRSTIQFWTPWAKGHSTLNFPFINSLKIWKCATNRDSLLLATLRYVIFVTVVVFCILGQNIKILCHFRQFFGCSQNFGSGNTGVWNQKSQQKFNIQPKFWYLTTNRNNMMHSFIFMGYFHKYFQLHQRIIIID